ncbi:hypothetical protein F8388_017906 [Cannabis sativa]|uniref:Uncharacterized protein n=1 Tax=Cannabis sativa TaxID=3483 RepID=A0A7J6ETI9_CANSA|nr:hypothetical protein G4B88_012065 [Cannabis sativa]KAF4394093.1 hypothetical protein F8388_017906 [Cannabis sativa]
MSSLPLLVAAHGCAVRSTPRPTAPAFPGFHRPTETTQTLPKLNPNFRSLTFRAKGALRCQMRQRLPIANASNSNPSGGGSIEERSGEKTSNAAKGPPFLTIVAGIAVFSSVCWVIGSILIWLISLIANFLPK